MPNPPDHHLKLLIGDLVVKLALVSAENEALREQLAAQTPAKKKTKDPA